MSKSGNTGSENSIVTIIILLIVGLLFTGIFIQGVQVKQNNDTLKVSGGLFYSSNMEYSDIDNVELVDSIDYGSRSNGVSLLNYKIGIFSNKEYGRYKLFANSKIDKLIVVRYDENTLVFNGKDLETTLKIYNSLKEKIKN